MTSTPPQPTTTTSSSSHPARTLLSLAHSPQHATQIFTNKIKNKPLLLTTTTTSNPTTDLSSTRALRRKIRAHKQRYHLQHRHPRPLSAKEKRTLKVHDLRDEEVRYDIYRGLNGLWHGYILEVLGFTKDGNLVSDAEGRAVAQASHGSLIASADFHGMEVEVVRCRDAGRVGLRGIVVRETKGTVVVVTEKDQQRRVLKRGAVFRVVVELPTAGGGGDGEGKQDEKEGDGEKVETEDKKKMMRKLVFELHGDQLEVRPVERAVRKFKWKTMDYL